MGIESRLVRKGDSNRTILLLIPLSVVLFGLIGMGVADFEPVNKNSQSYHGVKHKMPFIHTVAVPERVAVQQNIPYYGASIQTCENMDSKALKGREKPGVPYIN